MHRLLIAMASLVGAHRLLGHTGLTAEVRGLSSCGSLTPEHRLNSCGARVYLLSGKWNLPGPRSEALSPDLAGKFFTTEPLGKSKSLFKILS